MFNGKQIAQNVVMIVLMIIVVVVLVYLLTGCLGVEEKQVRTQAVGANLPSFLALPSIDVIPIGAA